MLAVKTHFNSWVRRGHMLGQPLALPAALLAMRADLDVLAVSLLGVVHQHLGVLVGEPAGEAGVSGVSRRAEQSLDARAPLCQTCVDIRNDEI